MATLRRLTPDLHSIEQRGERLTALRAAQITTFPATATCGLMIGFFFAPADLHYADASARCAI